MENKIHTVLALKYRPQNFNELIGQDVMVQTITNSIKLNKLPNAYLLTGIRGVGKTTTARLIAKALNCSHGIDKICRNNLCENCKSISNSNHIDVIEMDAASKTGIDDVRELIESGKYNPASAKYKIFIIDEVHMLSKQAFNGLLKTLEEPPPHLKFIFATTEVKKIPVTIVSRCQRFDLNRISMQILFNNLKKIVELEKGKIADGALRLIAKTSEGSVRDSLSLLDRALISQNHTAKIVDENHLREMLGIADRSKILEILQLLIQGDQKKTIMQLRKLINGGLNPVSFLNDLLEIIHFVLQKKELEDSNNDIPLSETENEMINLISKEVNTPTLIIFWQFILKSLDELSIVSNQILLLEMLIIRLLHLRDIPSYESLLDVLKKNNSNEIEKDIKTTNLIGRSEKNKITKDQIKTTTQTKLDSDLLKEKAFSDTNLELKKINSFDELIHLSSIKKEIGLKYDLERNVNLVKFSDGKIDISFNEKLGKDFVRKLSEKLHEWTGKRWVISLTKEIGQKSFVEKKIIKNNKTLEEEKKNEVYKKFKSLFPDAELVNVDEKE
tara:strand:- start:4156 stop:5829 length:1674 start_codon:yes stop_codon:yes gene_type:complete